MTTPSITPVSSTTTAAATTASQVAAQSTSTSASSSSVGVTATTKPPRKLNRSANQLNRNQACLPCRRRRIKCDAARPHCASCVRSYRFLARTQPDDERDAKGVQCFYDDDVDEYGASDDEGEETSIGDPRVAVKKLEARISELQDALARVSSPAGKRDLFPNHIVTSSMSWVPEAAAGTSVPGAVGADETGHMNVEGGYGISEVPGVTIGSFTSFNEVGSSQFDSVTGPESGPSTGSRPLDNGNRQEGYGGAFGMSAQEHFGNNNLESVALDPNSFGPNGLDPNGIVQNDFNSNPLSLDDGRERLGMDMTMGTLGMIDSVLPPLAGAPGPDGMDDEAGKLGGPLFELFWPGWPPRLPTPAMLDHLVFTFFTMVPSISRILHRDTFMTRLALPPTADNFPHTALLHAICAVTARYSAAVRTISVQESMQRTNEQLAGIRRRPAGMSTDEEAASQPCFADRHAQFAMLEMRLGEIKGRSILEVAQAQVILLHYQQQHAKWIDGWAMSGAVSRIALPLGLMADTKPGTRLRNAIIEPPVEDWDREERRLLMTYIMTIDAICSASSGWPNSLALDELMARLPAGRADFDRGNKIPNNPQTWQSPDLYTNHPVADNFVMFAKGIFLLGQITKFSRLCQSLDNPLSARDSAQFRKLDGDIAAFNLSFPASLRDPLKSGEGVNKGIDADLISAHLVPHIAAIMLHESFADLSNPRDPSSTRLLAEARACLSMVYLLTSTTLDFSYVLHPINSCDYFFAAARTLVLFYQRALETSDHASARVFLNEIQVFKMAFTAMGSRFALGARHGGMIDQMLKACDEELGVVNEMPPTGFAAEQGADWRQLPHPFTNVSWMGSHVQNKPTLGGSVGLRKRGLACSVTDAVESSISSSNRPEAAVIPGHPDSMLFSSPDGRGSLKDKLDARRGFRRGSASTGTSSSQGPSPADGTGVQSPMDVNSGFGVGGGTIGSSWINWTSTANITLLSPEEAAARSSASSS